MAAVWRQLPVLQRRRPFLHHADPLSVVEPELVVGDHRAGLDGVVLGAKDQPDGATDGVSHLAAGRIERRGAGRVRVGEPVATPDELETS